ncbi:MAG TPA: hypothetical protein VK892_04265 [Pyrinomonadaceae bacterium]|nr:hypothetical protein [Pyrinomonadaceae bacterium]
MNNLDLDKMKIDREEIKKFFTESELRIVARFLDYVQKSQSKFGTDDASLAEIEKQTREYAKRRKANQAAQIQFAQTDDEDAEIDEIRQGIRDFYRRTRRVVNG